MRNSSAYHQYNSHLPKWLHNQPRQFITHCCQRLTHAQSITKEDISQEGDGQFLVKSQSDNKNFIPYALWWLQQHAFLHLSWLAKTSLAMQAFCGYLQAFSRKGMGSNVSFLQFKPLNFQIDLNVVPPLSFKECSSTDCTIMQDSAPKEKDKG